MPPEVAEAWDDFLFNHNENSKVVLIKYYSKMVSSIAYTFYNKKPSVLEHADLVAAGTIGLLQALDRYDPEHIKNASFETYAKRRVYGAILDQINELDWTPRSVRKNIRSVIKAEEQHQTLEDIQNATSLNKHEVSLARYNARRTYILPVDQETIRRMEHHNPKTEMESEKIGLWFAVQNDLTEIESQVIFLRFYVGQSILETSKILGISVNKVTTIQKRAIKQLRKIFFED